MNWTLVLVIWWGASASSLSPSPPRTKRDRRENLFKPKTNGIEYNLMANWQHDSFSLWISRVFFIFKALRFSFYLRRVLSIWSELRLRTGWIELSFIFLLIVTMLDDSKRSQMVTQAFCLRYHFVANNGVQQSPFRSVIRSVSIGFLFSLNSKPKIVDDMKEGNGINYL